MHVHSLNGMSPSSRPSTPVEPGAWLQRLIAFTSMAGHAQNWAGSRVTIFHPLFAGYARRRTFAVLWRSPWAQRDIIRPHSPTGLTQRIDTGIRVAPWKER